MASPSIPRCLVLAAVAVLAACDGLPDSAVLYASVERAEAARWEVEALHLDIAALELREERTGEWRHIVPERTSVELGAPGDWAAFAQVELEPGNIDGVRLDLDGAMVDYEASGEPLYLPEEPYALDLRFCVTAELAEHLVLELGLEEVGTTRAMPVFTARAPAPCVEPEPAAGGDGGGDPYDDDRY